MEIEAALSMGNLQLVDDILRLFDTNNTSPLVYTGVLRITARAKDKLKYWEDFHKMVVKALELSGEIDNDLLYGFK